MLFPEIESRLAELGREVDAYLNREQRGWFSEFLDVGDYGLALEMLADWLAEDDRAISSAFRSEALVLAHAMGIDEHISSTLEFCPELPGAGDSV